MEGALGSTYKSCIEYSFLITVEKLSCLMRYCRGVVVMSNMRLKTELGIPQPEVKSELF